MGIPDPPSDIYMRGIQLTTNLQLHFKVLPRLFGSTEKSRNYRRVFLDLVFFAPSGSTITLNILRLDPATGNQTTVLENQQFTIPNGVVNPRRLELESTYKGLNKYFIHVDSVSATTYLVGAWLSIDEYYSYGSDTLLN